MSALRRRQPAAEPVAYEARVSNPDPDELTVTIDDFDGAELARHGWPVVSWPRSGAAVPARGDRCLVVMSEVGRAWVVAGEWTGPAQNWITLEPTSGSNWSAYNRAVNPVGYAKSSDGWVTLRGLLTPAATPGSGTDIPGMRLPPGFCPATRRSFPVAAGGLVGRITVRPDGQLMVGESPSNPATPAIWTLDGIGYWAED
ncbi:hypothetical protein VSS74_25125 [Conexibacter stalactiti]|uniref:Uncharacterized protein n=1 Tax=Conexibacter stalactiti TaxID=1940611 RepID=A0ABU4HWQ6_9ACTN|nr:hypothetical protein [Conexibacter stalactiti]MDW5597658.1 hypothetical protein [Conexibacter stalactiti]MEC5038300.1 hypothetical protein [Conexibacter stalactiti]